MIEPAAIRPEEWNLPLLLHVLGAMLLVGSLALVAAAFVSAWSRDDRGEIALLTRLGFRSLLVAVLPSYLLMRLAGEWIASEENFGDETPTWLGVGYATADLGLLFLVAATIVAGLSARAARRGGAALGLRRAAAVLVCLLVVAHVVAVWAMTAKPG